MSEQIFSSLFDDPAAWQVFASGRAEGRVSAVGSGQGRHGLRLDYDFHGGGGFVVIRRELEIRLPETFEIGFHLRGGGPPNHFEFKVADPGGTNVWRHLRPDFTMPVEWSEFRLHERELPFAWGPAGGGAPTMVGAVEIVVAAGPGGKGFFELSEPWFEDQTLRAPAAVIASSYQRGREPVAVFDAGAPAGWRAAGNDAQPWWQVDFGRPLRFGGLVIEWPPDLPPRSYHIMVSNDGTGWMPVHHGKETLGVRSHIPLPGAEARYLRLVFGNASCAALASLHLRPDAFSHTPNEFIHHLAADAPRGWYPRYWCREQSYWTSVGSPGGRRRALINEEGMVEVDEASFSLEPFVLLDGRLVTWNDVETRCSLPAGGAPMPAVTWRDKHFSMQIQPWVDGVGDDLTLHTRYRLRIHKSAGRARLVVAVRPFQVNPPWQAFRNLGGRSPIHHIECRPGGMRVEGREVLATPVPDACGAAAFEQGVIPAFLTEGKLPPARQIQDESGLASGAMCWELPAGGKSISITVSVPYFTTCRVPDRNSHHRAHARWKKALGHVSWQVPDCAMPAIDCFRTAAAHILINRDGPAIQPGPRRYTRSWIRDCVIMGAALAKAGLPAPLRVFLEWYAPFQRDDGFVPCVVDRDGIDWLVEHDSHGQFLWGVRQVLRSGGDRDFLTKMLPHVRKAAHCIITLRQQRMTVEYKDGAQNEKFGLLPESASHEGYLAHPVHSYWDDFWGVRGIEAAADVMQALGLEVEATQWRREAADFQNDVVASLEKVITARQLHYIPGSVEWADFDPTATSNAVAMLDFADALPQGPLHQMLETYLDGHRRKHCGDMPWNNYTAYEIRIIGAFVRLGRREAANELLDFFLSDRRPREWNQWPEISWRDPRSPGHLGDVPHTWIAAEYLLAVASMVAAEREASQSLVLAPGMPWKWITEDGGFAVRNLPTHHGPLDFMIRAEGISRIHVRVDGLRKLPAGGLWIDPPLPPGMRLASGSGPLRVLELPFEAVLSLNGDPAT